MNKVTIIGTGSVGSTIAYTLAITGIASDICIIDLNKEKALGEALDIRQGTPFCSPVSIYAGDYCDAKDSDIVILTCGVARKPGQTRLDLAQTNVNIIKDIIPKITPVCPDAKYIIVSNPVDILTYVFTKCSNIDEKHIIGSGTILDTARLKEHLASLYNINKNNVHANVYGEHGDSSFVAWSTARITNVQIEEYTKSIVNTEIKLPELNKEDVENYVKKSGAKVIERKGATFYAVALSVCHICRCIFNGAETALTVSSMMHGEYGIEDVSLSVLNMIGRDGISSKIILPLEDEEVKKLQKSSKALKDVINLLNI